MRRVVLVLLPLLLIGTALPAAADPVGDKRKEAERVARELDEHAHRLSVVAEEYNEARIEAERVEERMSVAAAELAETQAKSDAAKARLRDQAVASYMHGGAAPALTL